MFEKSSHNGVSRRSPVVASSYRPGGGVGVRADVERRAGSAAAGRGARDRIHVDSRSGAAADRPGRRAVLDTARRGDVVVVHTLDRLGRSVRETLQLLGELTGRGVGVRNLADPIAVNPADPAGASGQLTGLLALFAQMEQTYTSERAAHARAVAAAHGRHTGRPSRLDPAVLADAASLRAAGHTMAQIAERTGMKRSSLYRYLPPRPPVSAAHYAEDVAAAPAATATAGVAGSVVGVAVAS